MSFVVQYQSTEFTPAPSGTHRAVCVDVVDLGIQNTSFGDKHRARFVWEIDETDEENGKPFNVYATMNVSLHENATMGALLRQWRGRDFTQEELAGFDVENVLGAPCLLTVEHNTKDGRTFANVAAAVPMPKAMEALEPSGVYTREIDRDESKDVRSKNYSAPQSNGYGRQAAPQGGSPPQERKPVTASGYPAGANVNSDGTYTFEPDDDLPFKQRGEASA